MLNNIFWGVMLATAVIFFITSIVNLVHQLKLNKLQRRLYDIKFQNIVSQCLVNIAKANEIVKEDK